MLEFHKAKEVIQEGGSLLFRQYENCILLDVIIEDTTYTWNCSKESDSYYQYMLDIGATFVINHIPFDLDSVELTDKDSEAFKGL